MKMRPIKWRGRRDSNPRPLPCQVVIQRSDYQESTVWACGSRQPLAWLGTVGKVLCTRLCTVSRSALDPELGLRVHIPDYLPQEGRTRYEIPSLSDCFCEMRVAGIKRDKFAAALAHTEKVDSESWFHDQLLADVLPLRRRGQGGRNVRRVKQHAKVSTNRRNVDKPAKVLIFGVQSLKHPFPTRITNRLNHFLGGWKLANHLRRNSFGQWQAQLLKLDRRLFAFADADKHAEFLETDGFVPQAFRDPRNAAPLLPRDKVPHVRFFPAILQITI